MRFGKWKEILEVLPVDRPDIFKFSIVLHHYARGLAFAALNKVPEAEQEEREFEHWASKLPEDWKIFNNTCIDISKIAREMLRGEIEYRKNNFDTAFEHLRQSVLLDDNLVYDEPWGWMQVWLVAKKTHSQPPRHALGALLLEQGRTTEAEEVYKEDLKRNPNNFWSLHGLAECQELQGKEEAQTTKTKAQDAQARFDVPVNASCFCRLSVV